MLFNKSLRKVALGAGVCLAMLTAFAAEGQAQRRSIFLDLAGQWVGEGRITVAGGPPERIRCRASYSVSPTGADLHQDLRCASDSYQVVVSSNIIDQGGQIAGTWTETTRGASGRVSGQIVGDQIITTVDGPGFTANLSLTVRGNRQSISIEPQGTTITSVTVTLRRS